MTRTREKTNAVRSRGAPDGTDINAVLEEIYSTWRVSCMVELYQDLAGDLVVCVNAGWRDIAGKMTYRHTTRTFTLYSAPVDSLILQCLHEMYHICDREAPEPEPTGPLGKRR